MSNSFRTDHNREFANDIVFILQIMSDAKSAPFAHSMLKNPCIPPKISKSHNFGKSREIRLQFRFEQREMEPSKFTVTRKSLNSPPPSHVSEIRAILVCPLPNCTPTCAVRNSLSKSEHANTVKQGILYQTCTGPVVQLLANVFHVGNKNMIGSTY